MNVPKFATPIEFSLVTFICELPVIVPTPAVVNPAAGLAAITTIAMEFFSFTFIMLSFFIIPLFVEIIPVNIVPLPVEPEFRFIVALLTAIASSPAVALVPFACITTFPLIPLSTVTSFVRSISNLSLLTNVLFLAFAPNVIESTSSFPSNIFPEWADK